MAVITFKKGDEYALKLSRLLKSDDITKKAIRAGAKEVADRIKSNLEDNLSDPTYLGEGDNVLGIKSTMLVPPKGQDTTGDLLNSFGISPIQRDRDGNWNAKIGFDGYDKRGVPNQLKARVMESGSSSIKKRPFVRPAIDATRRKAVAEMKRVIDEETKRIMGE